MWLNATRRLALTTHPDVGGDPAEFRTVEQAYRTALARPDFVMVAGDLVYYKGRLSEYLEKFFLIYNSDRLAPSAGAPLLRSTPIAARPTTPSSTSSVGTGSSTCHAPLLRRSRSMCSAA